MNNLLTLLAAALLSAPMMAATAAPDVKGQILDETGEPMPFVNVVLLNPQDSTFIQGSTSDAEGNFFINTQRNEGLLRISSVGYQTQYINVDTQGRLGSPTTNNVVTMLTDRQQLDEVTVQGQLPRTKLTAQGLQTDVQGSVLEKVGSAEDALGRVPGLMKTSDGLSVIGKGAPIYYINGRRVHDLQELKQLRSYEIASVEVINNPGAQYDATVNAVVRIKTIRRQGDGFGFNAGITDEQSLRYAKNNDPFGYLNTNWRHNDVDVFAGVSGLRWHSVQTSNMSQESYGSPSFCQDGTLDYRMEQRQIELNGGANWQINQQHSVGFRIDHTRTPMTRIRQWLIEDMKRNGQLEDHVEAYGHHDPDCTPTSTKVNTYYNGKAGKLDIDFNADYYVVNSSQLANTDEVSTAGKSLISTDSESKNKLFASKLVLTYPIWAGRLQGGSEATFSRRNEDYQIQSSELYSAGTSALIPTTESKVRENNIALFVDYAFQLPHIGQLSAGLRYEHVGYTYDCASHYHGLQTDQFETIEREDDNFFPSFAWANTFMTRDGSPVQVSLNYSMKTIRPDFYSLNSAIRYHSRYIWQSGNAALQNQINHEVGLNARYKIFTLIGQYECQQDALSQWSSLYNEDGIVLVKSCNLNDPVHKASYYLNLSPSFGCWTMNYTLGMKHQWFETEGKDPREASGKRMLNFNDSQFVAQCFNTWRFGAKKDGTGAWQLELGGTLQTKGHELNTLQTNHYFNLDAAIQKSFLAQDALTVRLEGTDLTKTANFDVWTDCGSHFIRQTNAFDQHRIKFSATYTFNAARSKYKGTGAGQDAQRRMSK